jgi:hypothetical protein
MDSIKYIISILLMFSFSFPSFSDEDRIYVNNRFGFKFRLVDNTCAAKSGDAEVYIFDEDTYKNNIDKDWGRPDLINGSNIYGKVIVFENTEFIDKSLGDYLESLPNKFNNWIKSDEYKNWTLLHAKKVEINNHEYIKELYSVNLNKLGRKKYQEIKEFISDRFGIEPIAPDDIINVIMIKGIKNDFQYNFHISFRDEIINEESMEQIINSFELIAAQEGKESFISNVNCHYISAGHIR